MNPPLSRLHWKVLFFSVDANLNAALVLVVGCVGFFVMSVSGGFVSTVHALALADDLSAFPAASTAFTWKACFPSPSGVERNGLVQGANGLPSRLH